MLSNSKKLASGSFLRMMKLAFQILISFFMLPFIVYHLGDRMFGLWTLVGTFFGYYGLLDAGLSSAASRYLAGAIGADNDKEFNEIFNTTLFLFVGIGIVALVIAFILAYLAPLFFNKAEDAQLFYKIVLILGINIAIDFPLRVFRESLEAKLRFDILTTIEILTMLIRTGLIVFYLMQGYGILAMAWITIISTVPQKFMVVYFSRKNFPSLKISRKIGKKSRIKSLFNYSIFTFIAGIADILRFNIDNLVIVSMISLSAATHYRIASTMITHYIMFVLACMSVLTPQFSQLEGAKDHDQIKRTFYLGNKIAVVISTFPAFGLIVWGKPFISRWMGLQYQDAYPCLAILSFGMLLDLWQITSISLLYGISKHRIYALFNMIEGVSNLILSLILVKPLGIFGVALGTFIPIPIIRLLIQPIYVCKVTSIPYREYINKMSSTIAFVCLSLVIPLIISVNFLKANYISLTTIGTLSTILYGTSIWFLAFRHNERHKILSAVLPKFLHSS